MLTQGKWTLALLLFLLTYVAVNRLLTAAFGRHAWRRRRLWTRRRRAGTFRHQVNKPSSLTALAELLQTADVSLSPAGFIVLTAMAAAAGFTAGTILFASLKGFLVTGALLAVLPTLWLRSRQISRQLKRRKALLPALESFYQDYVLAAGSNLRVALGQTVASGRLPRHAQTVFGRLHAGLAVQLDPADSLRLFAVSFASRWADLFAGLLHSALADGTDIKEGLRSLISDMRRAARNDQLERNRLLEIRLANFSPLLFLAVFLVVNFHIDPDLAWRYYVQSDAGREMLLDTVVLIGLSFVMGIYLSLQKE